MHFAHKLLPGDIEQKPSRSSVEFPVTAWQGTQLRDPSTLPRSRFPPPTHAKAARLGGPASRSRGVAQDDSYKISRLTCENPTDPLPICGEIWVLCKAPICFQYAYFPSSCRSKACPDCGCGPGRSGAQER